MKKLFFSCSASCPFVFAALVKLLVCLVVSAHLIGVVTFLGDLLLDPDQRDPCCVVGYCHLLRFRTPVLPDDAVLLFQGAFNGFPAHFTIAIYFECLGAVSIAL